MEALEHELPWLGDEEEIFIWYIYKRGEGGYMGLVLQQSIKNIFNPYAYVGTINKNVWYHKNSFQTFK